MFFLQTLSLLLPILVAGVFLIYTIKRKLFKPLCVPIDGGKKFQGRPIFGSNKTWRGIVIYVIGSIVVCCILWLGTRNDLTWIHPIFSNNPIILGILYGVSYSCGELINSFIKRRLRIRPGHSSNMVQYFFDTVDGIVLTILVLSIVYGANWLQLLLVLLIGIVVHLSTDWVMKKHRLKK